MKTILKTALINIISYSMLLSPAMGGIRRHHGACQSYSHKHRSASMAKSDLDLLINEKIKKYENETLQETFARLRKKTDKIFYKKTKKIIKVLEKNSEQKLRKKITKAINTKTYDLRLKQQLQQALDSDKSITQRLQEEISFDKFSINRIKLFNEIEQAGSYSDYLRAVRNKGEGSYVSTKHLTGRYPASPVDELFGSPLTLAIMIPLALGIGRYLFIAMSYLYSIPAFQVYALGSLLALIYINVTDV